MATITMIQTTSKRKRIFSKVVRRPNHKLDPVIDEKIVELKFNTHMKWDGNRSGVKTDSVNEFRYERQLHSVVLCFKLLIQAKTEAEFTAFPLS